MALHRGSPETKPVYLRIADSLRRAHEPGRQLPSVPKLAQQWGVARETIRSAIDVLRAEGLIISWQGRGTFYQAPSDNSYPPGSDKFVVCRLNEICHRLDAVEGRLTILENDYQQ